MIGPETASMSREISADCLLAFIRRVLTAAVAASKETVPSIYHAPQSEHGHPLMKSMAWIPGSRDLLYAGFFATSGEDASAQSCQITHHGAIAVSPPPILARQLIV
jgi:hypothetical protein